MRISKVFILILFSISLISQEEVYPLNDRDTLNNRVNIESTSKESKVSLESNNKITINEENNLATQVNDSQNKYSKTLLFQSILFLILTLLSLLNFIKIQRMNETQNNIDKKFSNLKEYVKKELDTFKELYDNRIKDIEEHVIEIKMKFNINEEINQEKKSIVEITSKNTQVERREILYAKSVSGGIFKDVTTEFNNNNLYFELSINMNENQGKFKVTQKPETYKIVISDGYENLISAVVEENQKDSFVNEIETVVPGTLEKVEGGWKITTKARIRYK